MDVDATTDRLIDALRAHPHGTDELELGTRLDRAVTRFELQKAGRYPWEAMDALKAAHEAWERRRSIDTPKAA